MSVNNTEYIIESLNHAKILNGLFRKGIRVKKCKKEGRRLSIIVESRQAAATDKFFEEYGCRYVVAAKRGVGHIANRFFSRYGLIAGIVIIVAALIVMSSFVLDIKIIGLKTVPQISVEQALSDNGVVPFRLKKNLNTSAILRRLNAIEGVASVSVVIKGVRVFVEIAEELPAGEVPDYGLEGLYASRDTIITKVVVQSGTAMVKVGDTVKAGTMLIAPFYTLEEDILTPVPARGEVYGKTYIAEELTFASERIEKVRTGKTKTASELYFSDARLGKAAICPYQAADIEISIVFLGLPLPLKTVYYTYYQLDERSISHNFELESPILIREAQDKLEMRILPSEKIVRQWNIIKNIDKIYIISIYYELEGRVDAHLPKEN